MKSIFVERSDTEVIHACLNHCLGAWEELVRRYRRLVYSIPLKFHLSHEDAMEIAQSVWTDCFEQLASLRCADHLQAWLVRITVRKCCRFIERAKNRHEVALAVDLEHDPAWTTNPYPELIHQLHQQQLLQAAIDRLSVRCRQIILALFFEDPTPTYALLAQRLNLSVNSIGFTRDRCLNCLAKILVGLGYEG
jgi:RNA polymerase sigma factor (sigma-70 family)